MWKVLLGVISLLPVAFFAAFFGWLIPSFFGAHESGTPSEFSQRFDVLMPAAIATSISLMILTVVYTVILAGRRDLQVGEKIGVPVAIFVTNGLLLPLVWWFYIWRGANLGDLSRSSRPNQLGSPE